MFYFLLVTSHTFLRLLTSLLLVFHVLTLDLSGPETFTISNTMAASCKT